MRVAELVVEEKESDKGPILDVSGELDLTTVAMLRDPLMVQAANNQNRNLIIDVSRVEFIDSAGLALLVEARKRLAADSRSLVLILSPGRQPERVLRLVRFDTIMRLVYGLEEIPAHDAVESETSAE
ncbi:MAG: STAS domain-containing protein [Capsulimonadaceae bacterium]|nr:STAS domain-containing protein [Capsulimonadaceae bacterium]